MGVVLKCIKDSDPEGRILTFETFKHMINDDAQEFFGAFDDHETNGYEEKTSHPLYAEEHPSSDNLHRFDAEDVKDKFNDSKFKYFLDGSRHVYKTSDIIINGVVYPVVSGQIIVGCTCREERKISISDYENCFVRKIVLVLPDKFDIDKLGKHFIEKQLEIINDNLKAKYKENAIQFSDLLTYDTESDKDELNDRNKYLHRAITKIQNEMMDQEQIMVRHLCETDMLGKNSWLIKDGTLEYKKEFSNRPDVNLDIAQFADHINHVIGASKMFNPELLSYQEKKISQIIATLPPMARTNAYLFKHQQHFYCVWYLRMRENPKPPTKFSDVIKVEFLMHDAVPISSQMINNISMHLLNEATPVCFGKDARWGNHLYPIYLTETYCKTKYIFDQKIINVI
ncbi:MAG: hypothetical protein MJ002_03965 [Paludibacteraceae bacterium]|nr:hypothetical protein [Paludibacteraceae bacterium]